MLAGRVSRGIGRRLLSWSGMCYIDGAAEALKILLGPLDSKSALAPVQPAPKQSWA